MIDVDVEATIRRWQRCCAAVEVLERECYKRRTRDVPEKGGEPLGERTWYDISDIEFDSLERVGHALKTLMEAEVLIPHRRNRWLVSVASGMRMEGE